MSLVFEIIYIYNYIYFSFSRHKDNKMTTLCASTDSLVNANTHFTDKLTNRPMAQ